MYPFGLNFGEHLTDFHPIITNQKLKQQKRKSKLIRNEWLAHFCKPFSCSRQSL
jgi:hypothetical protein